MSKDFSTVVSICQQIFPVLKAAEGQNLVLALGNTGCGKSTMFNGLLFGPDSLELKKKEIISEIIDKRTGEKKQVTHLRTVID